MWNATHFDIASTQYREAYAQCFGRAEYDPSHSVSSEELGQFVLARHDLIATLDDKEKNKNAVGIALESGDIDLFTHVLGEMTPQEAWIIMEMREMPIGRSALFLSQARAALIERSIQIPTKLNNALIRAAFRDKKLSLLTRLAAEGQPLAKDAPHDVRTTLLQSVLRGLAGYSRGPVARLATFLETQIGDKKSEEAWHEALSTTPLTWKIYLALSVCGFTFTQDEISRARDILIADLNDEQMHLISGSNHVRLKLLTYHDKLPQILAMDEATCAICLP